jgi:hypothetical protein
MSKWGLRPKADLGPNRSELPLRAQTCTMLQHAWMTVRREKPHQAFWPLQGCKTLITLVA